MASQEGCITVNWEIRNFSVLFKAMERRRLTSPNWLVVNYTEGRVWNNELGAHHYGSKIEFTTVHTPLLHFDRKEMSFISSCGVVLLKEDPSGRCFYLEKIDLLDKSSQSILLNETITLCCRMWGKELRTSEFHLTTVLRILNPIWTIEKLASSDSHDTCIEQDNFKLHASLQKHGYCAWRGTVDFEPCAPGDQSIVDYAVSVKDGFKHFLRHPYTNSENRKYHFDFDVDSNNIGVTLQVEVIVALHGRQELSASSQVVRETQLKSNSPTNIAEHKNVSGALGEDLLLLYRESALSDATLNTAGKSFSAHRTILAARSTVFRAMFERDETSEGRSGVVDIDDVDSETVDRMLVYLYGDSVGDLAWSEASALYYAADKYAIQPLKEKCADFLKACLAADNACDVLALADRHSDQELMTHVVNFILGHEEVVSSAQWGELEKGNPMLCAKIATQLFLKSRKK